MGIKWAFEDFRLLDHYKYLTATLRIYMSPAMERTKFKALRARFLGRYLHEGGMGTLSSWSQGKIHSDIELLRAYGSFYQGICRQRVGR
jgi:hypothetical protein